MAGLRRAAPDKMTLPNVLACNAGSIFYKSEDLNSLAQFKMNKNLYAVAVTETWLNADIDSTPFTPPGFLCFPTDRACKSNTRGGGTALFINQRWCSSPKQSFADAFEPSFYFHCQRLGTRDYAFARFYMPSRRLLKNYHLVKQIFNFDV